MPNAANLSMVGYRMQCNEALKLKRSVTVRAELLTDQLTWSLARLIIGRRAVRDVAHVSHQKSHVADFQFGLASDLTHHEMVRGPQAPTASFIQHTKRPFFAEAKTNQTPAMLYRKAKRLSLPGRLELPTSRLTVGRANQLRHGRR